MTAFVLSPCSYFYEIKDILIKVGEWAPVGEPVAISDAKPFLEFATGGTLGNLETNIDVAL